MNTPSLPLTSRVLRSLLVCAVPLALSTGACSGDSDSNGGGGGPPVPLAEVPELYIEARCDLTTRCLGPLLTRLFYGAEDCETLGSRGLENSDFYKVEDGVAAGEIAYDGTKVQPCLDWLATRECNLEERSNPICDAIFVGSSATGGECEVDEQCQGGDICIFETSCPGTCSARKAAGVTCAGNDECEDGLICHQYTNRCTAPAALDEPCDGGTEPQCGTTLACTGDTDTMPGTCKTLSSITAHGDGDVCVVLGGPLELCQEGLVCALDTVTDQMPPMPVFHCKQANTTSRATCNLAVPEDCPAGEYCPVMLAGLATGMFEAECAPLPAQGEACLAADRVGARCGPYLRCTSGGTCEPMSNNGESCEGGAQCYSGDCVNGGCAASALCD